jgi:putative methionine-R-sulfoxide reductase with GAF domain
MNNPLFGLPEDRPVQTRNTFWLLPTLLIIFIASSAVYVVALVQSGAWQMKVALGATLLLVVIAGTALWLHRIGRGTQGTILDICAMVLIFPIISTLYVGGIGLVLGFITPIAAMLLASAFLTRKQAIWAISAGILSGLTSILLDLYWPYSRVDVPLLRVFVSSVILLGIVVILLVVIRQFKNYTTRTKLIVSIVLITVTSVLSVVFFVDRSSRSNLTDTIGNNLYGLASGEAIQVAQTLESELGRLNTLALTKTVQDRAEAGTAAGVLSPDEIQALDQQWKAADAANNSSDPLVASVMKDSLTAELIKYQAKFPENVEVFLTDLQGVSLATTDRTSDYLQSDEEWWQSAYMNGEYIGQPEFDASSKTLAINMAVAVRASDSNRIVGVLRTTVNINSLTNVLQAGLLGKTGQTDLYLPDGQVIKLVASGDGKYELAVEKANLDVKTLSQPAKNYLTATLDNSSSLVSLADVSVPDNNSEAGLISRLGWYIVTHQNQSEALLPVTTQTQGNMILAVIVAILAALVALGLAQVLAGPIIRLNAAAEKVAAGDLTVQAKVESRDETGTLAATFNKMVSQLNGLVGSLEQRVADRTKALAASTEVSRRLSTILDPKQLVKEVVDQVQSVFNYYHVHIYLTDESSGDLIMAGGTGEAGATMLARGHKIQKGRGLVSRAASGNIPVLASDVSQDPAWLPNPLLPETKSEIAVPIAIGDQVLGVLDVQHNVVDGLKQEDVQLLLSVANQVAIGLQNARSFEQSRSQAELETLINTIGQKIQRAGTVEDVLQTAVREVGIALGASRVSASLQPTRSTAVEPYTAGGGNESAPKR